MTRAEFIAAKKYLTPEGEDGWPESWPEIAENLERFLTLALDDIAVKEIKIQELIGKLDAHRKKPKRKTTGA